MTISTVAGYALQKSLPCDNTFIEYWTATGPTGLAEVFFFDTVLLKRFRSLPAWGPFSSCIIGEEDGKAFLVVQDPVTVNLVDLQSDLSKGELIGLMWHVTSALAEVHDNGNAHGFLSAESIGFNEVGELRIQPDPSLLFYQDTDTTSTAIATDSALVGAIFKQLELLDQNNPSMQLLNMGLNQDLSRLRLQPATAIRQSISALAARYPEWEKKLVKRYGPVFALDSVPKPDQITRVRSYSSRRRSPSVNNELWDYSPYEQKGRTSQVPSAESMGQYLLRESLKQQGAELTDIEEDAAPESDLSQDGPSALRIQVPTNPTVPTEDPSLAAWDDFDDDSEDFVPAGGAVSINLGTASPLSNVSVAAVQPLSSSRPEPVSAPSAPQVKAQVQSLESVDTRTAANETNQTAGGIRFQFDRPLPESDGPLPATDGPLPNFDEDSALDLEDDTAAWAAGFADEWKAEQSLIDEYDDLSEERPPLTESDLDSTASPQLSETDSSSAASDDSLSAEDFGFEPDDDENEAQETIETEHNDDVSNVSDATISVELEDISSEHNATNTESSELEEPVPVVDTLEPEPNIEISEPLATQEAEPEIFGTEASELEALEPVVESVDLATETNESDVSELGDIEPAEEPVELATETIESDVSKLGDIEPAEEPVELDPESADEEVSALEESDSPEEAFEVEPESDLDIDVSDIEDLEPAVEMVEVEPERSDEYVSDTEAAESDMESEGSDLEESEPAAEKAEVEPERSDEDVSDTEAAESDLESEGSDLEESEPAAEKAETEPERSDEGVSDTEAAETELDTEGSDLEESEPAAELVEAEPERSDEGVLDTEAAESEIDAEVSDLEESEPAAELVDVEPERSDEGVSDTEAGESELDSEGSDLEASEAAAELVEAEPERSDEGVSDLEDSQSDLDSEVSEFAAERFEVEPEYTDSELDEPESSAFEVHELESESVDAAASETDLPLIEESDVSDNENEPSEAGLDDSDVSNEADPNESYLDVFDLHETVQTISFDEVDSIVDASETHETESDAVDSTETETETHLVLLSDDEDIDSEDLEVEDFEVKFVDDADMESHSTEMVFAPNVVEIEFEDSESMDSELDEGEDETLESLEVDDDSSETALFEVSNPEDDSGPLNSTDEAAPELTSEVAETDDVLSEANDFDSIEDAEAQEQSVDEFNEVFDLVSGLLASEADDSVDLTLTDVLPFVDEADNAELPLPDSHPVEANEIESIEPLEPSAAEPLDDSHSSPDDADIGEGQGTDEFNRLEHGLSQLDGAEADSLDSVIDDEPDSAQPIAASQFDEPHLTSESSINEEPSQESLPPKPSRKKSTQSLPFKDKSHFEPSWASLADTQGKSTDDELGAGKWTESGRSSAEIEKSLGSSSVREFEIDHGGSAWGMIIVAVVAVVVVVVGFWAIGHNDEEAALETIADVEDVMEAKPSVTRTVRVETEPKVGTVIFDDIDYGSAPVSVPLPDDYDQEHTLCVQWGEERRSCRQVRRGDFSAGTYYFELTD